MSIKVASEHDLMMCSLEELETMLQHAEEALIDAILIVPFPPFRIIRTDELKSTNTGSTPDTTASQVGHVFPLQSFQATSRSQFAVVLVLPGTPLNNRYAFCSQPRRAHNQTRLTRRLSSAGVGFSNHHTPRQLAQVNSVHITSTLTLVQLRDIIGQSCLTSFHTPSSLQQHQLFVLHPTQCTDNHNIKTQPQRKMRKENRKGTPDFDDRRSILVQSISPHTVPTLRRTPNQTARQRRQPSVKMHSIRASEDSG
ncbi:hypothetical protein BLNAU_21568 [Blattamonas nauphoetae]|uniref:Uncharacterized protein n=1 Tax=Blattamonas nauphoetae TaxID=2049346 RepID=A0ABQ9WVI0_9EUKA|nr:hypothetical protein BLNAU_21568 [Blattamonas nauphoetae]